MTEYKLIEELREAGLDDFVPSDEDIEEALANREEYDENAWLGTKADIYGEADVDEDDRETMWEQGRMTFAGFCQMFDIKEYENEYGELVSIEDQLDQSLNELLGITKPQLKFIDQDLVLTQDKMQDFVLHMRSTYLREHFLDVEERIAIATILAYVGEKLEYFNYDQALRLYKSEDDFGKAIEKIRLWWDYYDMYGDVHSILQGTEPDIGEDRDKLWKLLHKMFAEGAYPKPSHVRDLHDKMVRFKQMVNGVFAEKDKAEKNPLLKEITKSPLYRKFVFQGKQFSVRIIKNYDDLAKEGKELESCVLEYAQDIIDDTSLIYAIRANDAPNTPLYTAEIKRGKTLHDGKEFRLTQCYGYQNTTEKSPELRDFIRDWCTVKGLKIECEI